jgi:hypothetical protein
MTDVRGLNADSPFVSLLGDPPIPTLLAYVHQSWLNYVGCYKDALPSFQKRTEPQLTQALAAYLRQRQDRREQPFAGDFFGELSDYVLDTSTGLPKCMARTDIEWRLYGIPRFILEFKILDGKPARRQRYLLDGVMRFVAGRYSSSSSAGAMFALLRKAATNEAKMLLAELAKKGAAWQCIAIKQESSLLPKIAAFDTSHARNLPHITPFHLAHLFVSLPL